LSSFIDYTVNGLVIGNIYALLAVGLALIFGVANLINFAHGSVYTSAPISAGRRSPICTRRCR
jgi:branched-subunit amino acid ABC-type transport system permease component